MKIRVRATPRPNFSGFCRAGRFWPSSEFVNVEVADQEDDPLGADGKPQPAVIGRRSLAELRAEKHLVVEVDGETPAAALAQANDELVALKAKLDAVERARVEEQNLLGSLRLILEKERNEVELKSGTGPVDVLMRLIRERHESAALIAQLREQVAAKASEKKGAADKGGATSKGG